MTQPKNLYLLMQYGQDNYIEHTCAKGTFEILNK